MIKKIGKRLLPLLLAVLMLFSVMPMQAFAVTAGEPYIDDYSQFLYNLNFLEICAEAYAQQKEDSEVDALDLVIKYIRTGVDRYNSGSWGIMAGKEDEDFAEFAVMMGDMINEQIDAEGADMDYFQMAALKNLKNITLPNGDRVDLGHVFGTMDITNHNSGSENHADVGGWAGDLVDLLELSDKMGVSGTIDEMVAEIAENCLGIYPSDSGMPSFSESDILGDIDAYYIMQKLSSQKYEPDPNGDMYPLTTIFMEYFTEDLTLEKRAEFFLKNRLGTTGTKDQIREVVYKEYTGNKVVSTLEGTRGFTSTGLDLMNLRKATCYAFADYLCKLAGDYVENGENPYFSVFDSEITSLAPGVTQEIKYATSAEEKQMIYYIATADVTRSDVDVYANYNENDPSKGWAMSTVLDQANAAQEKYGNPDSEHYIENYNVVASTNGAGFDMKTGEPGGLLVMGGVEYHPINDNGFFGILKDGTPVLGTTEEYNTIYKDKVRDGIAQFGATLVKDGKIVTKDTSSRAGRTAVGITKTGKVVLMVLDGRQGEYSNGGNMVEIAHIMLEAGCVHAVNLDGGGSTTYVAKPVGEDELSVVNSPSDGYARSVSASLMMVSTAPSSTKFDHAVLNTDYDYITKNTSIKINPIGVSATGNTVDLPEGTSWSVSDERWATITEDGVLTGLRDGSVEIYLMADGAIIGSKTINIVTPDKVYYKKAIIDAIYESTVKIPVLASFSNNPVAFNEADVVFTLSNDKAGTVEGFEFRCAAKSEIRSVKITAALAANSETTADITVNLYDQGEATFDFEQATGGNRQLAWDRKVSNSTTENNIDYLIENVDEDMVTSYIVALDMTEIPIPQVLSDLVYMLPGADVEGANAWMFLCQLAERISTLTEVKATLNFDTRFDVDYSKLVLVNEYFTLKDTSFNEETNQLVLTLNWNKQTQSIDSETANPLCIVSGINLTPKADADWGDKNTIAAVNTGNISYMVYMRASALYTFAQNEENQQKYGIMPYVNPDDEVDRGGGFGQTYTEFHDTYNLVKAVKNGWTYENGGYAYYVDGEKLTGVNKVDGYYYDFGDDGVNFDQSMYTGLFFDKEANVYRYSKVGELATGWQMADGTNWYYFNKTTKAAVSGKQRIGGVYFDFEENGKLVSGVWANTLKGTRYYYGPSYYTEKWKEIDGESYYFKNGYRLTGVQQVRAMDNNHIKQWFDFGEDGKARMLDDGLHTIDGSLYYILGGIHQIGLHKVDGDYYFFTYAGKAVTGQSYYTWETHCDLPCSTYAFGKDGKMVNGLAEMNDGVYYYVNGKIVTSKAGLTKIGDDYYFVSAKGRVATGRYYAWATNCDLPCGNYEFGADGKMLQGVVEKDDGYYYYINGNKGGKNAGLTKIGDDYYFVASNGRCAVGTYYAWATNCDLPCSNYEFGADGKMLQGIVEKADGYYYYINGKKAGKNAGLTKVGEDYYFVAANGRCATGTYYAWATNCDLPCSSYEFAADGKMLQGVVEKEDGYYYYINGKKGGKNAGLTKVGDDYYFVAANGRCATGKYYAWATNCDLPCADYEFGADGKALQGIVIKNNAVYCYVNGQLGGKTAGLTKIGEDYYFISSSGKCATGKYYAWATNCDLPCGDYEFDENGKMLNGFVNKADGIYYYENGKVGRIGLNYIDGYYYFIVANGKLVTNKTYYVWETNGLLIETNYTFDEFGRIVA